MQTTAIAAPESTSFADDLIAVAFADDHDHLLPSPSDFTLGLADDSNPGVIEARYRTWQFLDLLRDADAARRARDDRREGDVDAEGRTRNALADLDEAAEMGREQGLSLRSALVPSGYTFDQRDAYLAAYSLAYDYAEAEALSDREDDWSDCEADSLEDRYQSYLDCERAEMGSSIGHVG